MNPAKNNNNSTYGYPCEYCEGTVQPKTVAREAFKHKKGFIILEADRHNMDDPFCSYPATWGLSCPSS